MRLIGRSVCSRKVIKCFLNVHFSCVIVEVRVGDSHRDGFSILSGKLFVVLVCYLKDVGSGVVAGNAVFLNWTGDMTTVFFTLCSKHLLDTSM